MGTLNKSRVQVSSIQQPSSMQCSRTTRCSHFPIQRTNCAFNLECALNLKLEHLWRLDLKSLELGSFCCNKKIGLAQCQVLVKV